MHTRWNSSRRSTSLKRVAAIAAVLALMSIAWLGGTAFAQSTGVIAGSVTTDEGVVHAFRVKARDTVARIAYTVYTVDGQYQIFNLPPSTYEVQIVEDGFEPMVKTTQVGAGNTATVDLALTSTGVVSVTGAAAGAAAGQENYGRRQRLTAAGARLVSFDELYPPHPARGRHAALLLRVPRTGRVPQPRAYERSGMAPRRPQDVRRERSGCQHERRRSAVDV